MTNLEKTLIALCTVSIISAGVCVFAVCHHNHDKSRSCGAGRRYRDNNKVKFSAEFPFEDDFDELVDWNDNVKKTTSWDTKDKLDGDKNVVTETNKLSTAEYSLIIDKVFLCDMTEGNSNGASIIIDANGKDSQVSLTTDKNIADEVKVVIDEKAKTIMLSGEKGRRYNFSKFELKLQTKVNKVGLGGGFNLDFDLGKVDAFALTVSGGITGKIKADAAKDFKCSIFGGGDLSLDGSSESLDIRIDGGGQISAHNFKTQTATVVINGAGKGEIHVLKTLKVNICGCGVVLYSGDPQVEKSVLGVGSVKKL
ncbi:hypothetical protein FACS1894198_6860 [Clostridia bacterium]|nr:hypothetical protein FACS1894198_6860 [Clostridia bacterium]